MRLDVEELHFVIKNRLQIADEVFIVIVEFLPSRNRTAVLFDSIWERTK